jgi:hypothetical protein
MLFILLFWLAFPAQKYTGFNLVHVDWFSAGGAVSALYPFGAACVGVGGRVVFAHNHLSSNARRPVAKPPGLGGG